ncbi:hypothetical protein RRG08_022583 [Elysia crispata]|uniref:F-box domain-containing protein n=1 Tax=Elysia crispata TaxID=231223 RepID=A0AAE0Z1H8_9GAST|nr:hypothetical protein RRG08_022583 [Elysia crispata]
MASRGYTPSQHTSYLQKYLRTRSNTTLSGKSSKDQTANLEDVKSSIKKATRTQPFMFRESTFTVNSSQNGDPLLERPHTSINSSHKTHRPTKFQILPSIHESKNKALKASVGNIPDEILSTIFWKLQIGDLITASQVCRRWYRIAGDNLLWKRYYIKFVGPSNNEPEDLVRVQDLERCCWKNLCLKRCKSKRDQIYLKKWRHPDNYTGLKQRPELTLGKVGIRFELSFLGAGRGQVSTQTHTLCHDDVFWLTTSASVRWYSLVFPDVSMVRGLQIHACSPLMFYGPAKPARDGIIQKSLLLTIKTNLKEFFQSENPLGEDEHVQLFEVSSGVLVALYKVDNELAFLMCVLHYHNLVSRCLSGTSDRSWMSPRRTAPQDDIDPHYGLHGYSCVLILRNTRQKILECKFSDLHTSKDILAGDFAVFYPVHKNDKLSHVTCLRDISFPWRTSLFKGIIQNVAILDMTLLDEGGEPFWTATGMVSFQTSAVRTDQFDFSPESYRFARYEDRKGQVAMEIGKLDCGTSYLSHLEISLSLAFINKVFHTSYGNTGRESSAKSARAKLASAAKNKEIC